MKTFTKYMLLQLPGWALVGLLLLWLWPRTGWSAWIAVAGYAVYVIKDFALYPLLRSAYEGRESPTGGVELIGRTGVAQQDLDPQGYVTVAGERWRARVRPGEKPIAEGTRVRITGASGLTLYVSSEAQARDNT